MWKLPTKYFPSLRVSRTQYKSTLTLSCSVSDRAPPYSSNVSATLIEPLLAASWRGVHPRYKYKVIMSVTESLIHTKLYIHVDINLLKLNHLTIVIILQRDTHLLGSCSHLALSVMNLMSETLANGYREVARHDASCTRHLGSHQITCDNWQSAKWPLCA